MPPSATFASRSAPAFGAAILAGCLFAGYWSVRFAVADFLYGENTLDSLRKAVALAPGDAAYRALLAEHLEGAGINPDSELRTAAALSPLESRYWIRLGFRAEVEHDYAKAEQYLFHAAEVDRKFAPRWALMNFYFRRDNVPEFWRWTDKAFELSYGDLNPMFQLMWNTTSDPEEVSKHIPRRNEVEIRYLWFLINSSRLEGSVPIAMDIASEATGSGDSNVLLTWWERTYPSEGLATLAVWNTLCRRKILPYSELRPNEGRIITNGNFDEEPIQRGTDWRIAAAEGVHLETDSSARELSMRFSGKEPESITLIEQWLPVEPDANYVVKCDYRSASGSNLAGLNWTVSGLAPREEVLARSPDFTPGSEERPGSVSFPSFGNRYVRLSLCYKRPLGSVRAEGTVLIRNVTAEIVK